MKKIFALLFCLVLISCTTPPDPSAYLRISGHDIVDGQGNKIFLRTVGLGNWLLPEGYMWMFGGEGDRPRKIEKLISDMIGEEKAADFWQRFRRDYITEADIARIKELGFNGVRPAMNWRLFMDEETGKFISEGFVLIDNLVEWCKIHQVYILLDMHGAPGGQTGANIDDSPNDFPELFSKEENQARFIALWEKIAQRYKNEPIIIAYGLINEPLPDEFSQFHDQLEPLYKRTTKAIRAIDKNHIITLEGAHWSTNFRVFGPPFDANTVYQFHKYWSTPDTKSIQQYIDFRAAHNVPLYLGESGENTNDWYWAAYQLYEDHNIGWLFWPWKKMDTENTPYSIKMPEGWEKIAAYSRGGDKPPAAEAEAILIQFLENIKLANCEFFPDVVNAVFRRVPAVIQAENYGHKGPLASYVVQDTLKKAEFYRPNEPVQIVKIAEDTTRRGRRDDAEYAVRLRTGEGLNYEINSAIDQVLKVRVKAKSLSKNPLVHLQLDGRPLELSRNYKADQWFYNQSTPMTVTIGRHDLKILVDYGEVLIDWLEVR